MRFGPIVAFITPPSPVRGMETRTAHPVAYAFEKAVAELKRDRAIEGAILASRDGLLVANAWLPVPSPEVFCAMHAAALGAAELALRDGNTDGVSLIADVAGKRFVSHAISRELFVVAMVPPSTDCHAVFDWMGGLRARIGA